MTNFIEPHHEQAVLAVAAHVHAVQSRTQTRLAQIEEGVHVRNYGPIALVDIEYLVRDVISTFIREQEYNP